MSYHGKKLLVVSNRLPVVITRKEDDWQILAGSGGLITALTPLMKRNQGIWLGWPGCPSDAPANSLLENHSSEIGYNLKPVILEDDDIKKYYRGFANQALWPLFHDLLSYASFNADHWEHYCRVNRKFAVEVLNLVHSDHFVWIHDYQLIMVGQMLREMGFDARLNYFLHIPFPSADLFMRLPWRAEILRAFLAYDHIGFQTAHDRRNFIQCFKAIFPQADTRIFSRQAEITVGELHVKLGIYPISIEFEEFNSQAKAEEITESARYIRENLPSRTLVLGLDRLDYTKGIPERMLAFERLLEKYPDLHRNISLVQIVVPSRAKVPEYRSMKEQIDQLVGRINSRFSVEGWVPIHYMYRDLDRAQLLSYYRACEIALITPLRDGMNLVSKEYCAASVDNNGVLILSEFAGAADQFEKAALMVNPYDLEGTADALYTAYIMPAEERAERMRVLRSEVRRNNVQKWVEWFLEGEAIEKEETVSIPQSTK